MSYSRDGKPAKTRVAKIREIPSQRKSYAEIVREKWAYDFVEAMRNRIVVGTHRYANGCSQYESRECGDSFLERMREKLQRFECTRNHEMLVDVAVYCMLLWRFDDNPRAHFSAEDQGG